MTGVDAGNLPNRFDMVISMSAVHRPFTFFMFSTSMARLESSFVILAVVSLGILA